MKFFAQSTQPIYLSHHGPPPPPLRLFDVYYAAYPQVGFTVVGSTHPNYAQVSVNFVPPSDEPIADRFRTGEQGQPTSDDWILRHPQADSGAGLETPQPMHIPAQAPVVAPDPREASDVELGDWTLEDDADDQP